MLRVVLDTNVLVSALISDGKSRELLKMGIVKQYAIVISDLILKELALVLSRPKFKTSQDEVQRVIVALMRTAEVVNVTSKLKAVKEDPKDDMIVDTAYDGNANMIVTGDSHLLALNEYREIKIVTVEKMIAYLNSNTHK
ncbi:MAG: putative toxin-antitoxin system toxin component, PIN family [Crenarchaeota archaeon]|nr:putative toxin-antitoxin system toxin component, PIN family [Thermoproteota archaeon]